MDLKELKKVIEYGKENIRTTPRLYILWREVYDKNFPANPICGGCGDSFGSAYDFMLISYNSLKNKKTKKMDANSKFELKEDGVIDSAIGMICNDNLTDEIAIQLLQESENHIKAFKKFPANWKELVSNTPTLVQQAKDRAGNGEKSYNQKSNKENSEAGFTSESDQNTSAKKKR